MWSIGPIAVMLLLFKQWWEGRQTEMISEDQETHERQ